MTIRAYLGLDEKFGPLDAHKLEWVKHNFSGTKVLISRSGKERECSVNELAETDLVLRVFGFPAALGHLVNVNDRLLSELAKENFNRFMVLPAASKLDRVQKVAEANQLVEKAKAGAKVRNHAAVAIESLMDGLAQGKGDIKAVEKLVEQIVENSYMDAMSALATLKQSDQTYGHCVDVGAIFAGTYQKICERSGRISAFKNLQEALLAALLHDVGKSSISKEILESPEAFEKDSPQIRLLRSHPDKSRELLEQMGLPKVAVEMGWMHHVKVDTAIFSSYPKNLAYEQVCYEAKLLAIIDVFQALTGRRPYKKSWTAPAAMRYLDALVGVEFDEVAWEDFSRVLGLYPVGSLVQLSDQSQAFVMNVPEGDLERPLVVLLTDASGNRLGQSKVLDLSLETSLKIAKELDPIEILGEDALEQFLSLKAS